MPRIPERGGQRPQWFIEMLMELKNHDSCQAWGQLTHLFQVAPPEPENDEGNEDHVVTGLAPGAINICPRWGHKKDNPRVGKGAMMDWH